MPTKTDRHCLKGERKMTNDPEQQLYKDMADLTEKVPKLQNEIKSQKRRLTRLSNRVESLELLALQDQISNLNDKVDSINTNLADVARTVAITEIDNLKLHMVSAIRRRLSVNNSNRTRLREYISTECIKARERARTSSSPIDLLDGFRDVCISCSREYDLRAFAHKP